MVRWNVLLILDREVDGYRLLTTIESPPSPPQSTRKLRQDLTYQLTIRFLINLQRIIFFSFDGSSSKQSSKSINE